MYTYLKLQITFKSNGNFPKSYFNRLTGHYKTRAIRPSGSPPRFHVKETEFPPSGDCERLTLSEF